MLLHVSRQIFRRQHALMPMQNTSCFTQGFADESGKQEQQGQGTEVKSSDTTTSEAKPEGTEASIMKKCKEVLERLKLNKALEHQDEKNISLGHRMQHDAEFTFRMLLASRSIAQRQLLKNRPPGMNLQQLLDSSQ